MKYKTGLLIGRFQPFHKGHLYLIKKGLKVCDRLIIGIGSANIIDKNNPFDFKTRFKVLKAVVYKEKLQEKIVQIIDLDDFYNDKKWLKNVEKKVKKTEKIDLVIGNNEWTNKIMEKAGYKILRCPYYQRSLYEGWRIRELIKNGKEWRDRVPRYLVPWLKSQIIKKDFIKSQFNHIVLGGTFDHLHLGHQKLLKTALDYSKQITVGLTTEKLYENKLLSEKIESYKIRHQNLEKFFKNYLTYDRRIDIVPLSDIFGPSTTKKEYDAIVVSKETFTNAIKINEKRLLNKLRPLQIIIIADVLDKEGKRISSQSIRKELIMPEILRKELQKPFGKVFKTVHQVIKFIKFIKPKMVISVGDIISMSLEEEKIIPDVKIIDYRSRKQPIDKPQKSFKSFENNPGTINIETSRKLHLIIEKYLKTKKSQVFIINGEEDLLALPAIIAAPLNSLVIYGHFQLGIICVSIKEEVKKKAKKLISKFA